MLLRKAALCTLIFACSIQPTATAEDISPPNAGRTLFTYPGNHGFLHQTGKHVPYGWAAMHRIHIPGYFIEGQSSGGELLKPGTYRYVFSFELLPGQLSGLLSNADDVIRIEAWDATTHENLMSRTFQVTDFLPMSRKYIQKTLTFSTLGRDGHRFEPKIYWPGLSGIFLRKILLQQLQEFNPDKLNVKAEMFEKAMGELYIDRGFVVGRRLNGSFEDVADAAIWTGMYAAAEAWRYKATRSREALERMQDSLRALHQLYAQSPKPGTLVRYVDRDGRILAQAPSKDTYTGFFFAIAQCLPSVKDRALRKDLLADVDGLASHFLDNNLSFVPAKGRAVDMNPSLSMNKIAEAIEDLKYKPAERARVIRVLEAIRFYFLIHTQQPWPELSRMIRNLKQEDFDAVHRDMMPFLNGALRGLQRLQRNVHKSAIVWKWNGSPYQKLDQLLQQMLKQLSASSHPVIQNPEDLQFLASHAQHALHILKVAGQALPRPNRYEAYYRENLFENKALLKTAWEWNGIDDELIKAVAGEAQAAAARSSSGHLSYLALFDLAQKERNPKLKAMYAALFGRGAKIVQADYNAMLQVMQPVLGLEPAQNGLAFWSLTLYPENRQGRGEAYWQANRRELIARYGGEVAGKARDPLPVHERQRDAFIWQRSAHSLRGDDATQLYPPLDYLFVYWFARANRQISLE